MKKILLIILIIPRILAQGPTASFIYNPVCLEAGMIFTDFSYPDFNTTNSF